MKSEQLPKRPIPVVAGNWKANGNKKSLCELLDMFQASEYQPSHAVECILAPPLVYIPGIVEHLSKGTQRIAFKVAAQNCIPQSGAYTGEVDLSMLRDCGVSTVVLGHSERRSIFLESDAVVATKVEAALRASFTVIACVGETLDQREKGETIGVVQAQLRHILAACTKACGKGDAELLQCRLILAYEPVWAIGTGKVASPSQAQEVHAAMRSFVAQEYCGTPDVHAPAVASLRILYGGSVSAANAKELYRMPDINGFLVGGASLKPEFLKIIQSTQP